MTISSGPKTLLALLFPCLLLESYSSDHIAAGQRHDNRTAEARWEAKKSADTLKKALESLPQPLTVDADDLRHRLTAAQEEVISAQSRRADQAGEDLENLYAPLRRLAVLFHLAFLLAFGVFLWRSLHPPFRSAVFAGFGLTVLPIVLVICSEVLFAGSGGMWTDMLTMAFLSTTAFLVVRTLGPQIPFFARVDKAACAAWPFILSPWAFIILIASGGPVGMGMMVYLTATAILAVKFVGQLDHGGTGTPLGNGRVTSPYTTVNGGARPFLLHPSQTGGP